MILIFPHPASAQVYFGLLVLLALSLCILAVTILAPKSESFDRQRIGIGCVVVAGICIISLSDQVFTGINLTAADKFSVIATWLSGGVVAFFSLENMRLVRLGKEQLKTQEEAQKNAFLPVIVPIIPESLSYDSFSAPGIRLINHGRGIAINVFVAVNSIDVYEHTDLAAAEAKTVGTDYADLLELLNVQKEKVLYFVSVHYRDIYGRQFYTNVRLRIEDRDAKPYISKVEWRFDTVSTFRAQQHISNVH